MGLINLNVPASMGTFPSGDELATTGDTTSATLKQVWVIRPSRVCHVITSLTCLENESYTSIIFMLHLGQVMQHFVGDFKPLRNKIDP